MQNLITIEGILSIKLITYTYMRMYAYIYLMIIMMIIAPSYNVAQKGKGNLIPLIFTIRIYLDSFFLFSFAMPRLFDHHIDKRVFRKYKLIYV